ncbi:kinase-like protein [Thelephora ganbajun]|uniref:Kinase-like protein n=1 Tax=Thelephora ganbajun TaxID=370292 RepID=A0ACB6ZQ71_THEGA|nr:kinase-like protein [Thelephora ganbajun]
MAPAKAPCVSTSDYLSLISENEVSCRDAQRVLTAVFAAHDYIDRLRDLPGWSIDPQAYINGLDRVGSRLTTLVSNEFYHRFPRALRKTCGIYGFLPSSHIMPPGLTLVTTTNMKRSFASGGFSDVRRARGNGGQIFAIKHLRTYEVDDLQYVGKKYCKEVMICRWIRHENVLNIEGVAPELFDFCMVSKWMDNRNTLQYVRTREKVDRRGLLLGITRGLHHLHLHEVIHGDLKGPNILIDDRGNPLLADFGLSSIAKNVGSVNASTPHGGGTIRWSAPELLDAFSDESRKRTPTVKSDIYALLMVIIELHTGNIPFVGRQDPTIIPMVTRGERPPKPVSAKALGLNPAVWELTKRCWHKKPVKRPETPEILTRLGNKKVKPLPSLLRQLKGIFSR